VVTTSIIGTLLLSIQIHVGAKQFEIFVPTNVEVSSPDVYGRLSDKFSRKKWRLKNTVRGSLRVKLP